MKYLLACLLLCGCENPVTVGKTVACTHYKMMNETTGQQKCMGHITVEVTEEQE